MTTPDWAESLDPSPPSVLRQDITALVRTPGTRRHLQVVVEGLDGVALPSVDVVSSLVDVDLILEVVGIQGVAIGELGAMWTGPCRRCLEPVHGRAVAHVHEIFDKEPVEGETYRLEDEFIDLRPMVREALVLSLPLAPLCDDGCVGPAPEAFPARVATIDGEAPGADDRDRTTAGDPRWAALDGLNFDE